MKKLFFPFLGLCATLFLTQCDKIEEPFKEIGERKVAADTPYFETKTDFVQKYLLEDFTGHRCLNCPKAHDIMHEMQQQMGDTLVCMGIHSGENAEPAAASAAANISFFIFRFLFCSPPCVRFSVCGHPCGRLR